MRERINDIMSLKTCPQCRKQAAAQARICTCGYWFTNRPPSLKQPFAEKPPAAAARNDKTAGMANLPEFADFFPPAGVEPDRKASVVAPPEETSAPAASERRPPAAEIAKAAEPTAAAPPPDEDHDATLVRTRGATVAARPPARRAASENLSLAGASPVGLSMKRTLKKILIVVCFFIFVSAAGALIAGYTDFFQSDEKAKKAAFADEEAVRRELGGSDEKRFAKGRLAGRVTEVASGDLLVLNDERNQPHRIRLGEIVAPAPDEPFGAESKANLETLVLDKTVVVNLQKIGDDGTLVGKVLLDGASVNLEQVRAGFARHDTAAEQLEEDRLLYAKVESDAKTARTGLWANGDPLASAAPVTEERLDFTVPNQEPRRAAPLAPPATESPLAPPTAAADAPTETPAVSPSATTAATAANPTPPAPATPRPEPAKTADAPRPAPETAPSAAKTGPAKRTYILGPRGGCYYINANGNRSYVDRSMCQ